MALKLDQTMSAYLNTAIVSTALKDPDGYSSVPQIYSHCLVWREEGGQGLTDRLRS